MPSFLMLQMWILLMQLKLVTKECGLTCEVGNHSCD